ncbi:MAG TPA: acyl-CoA dehydrogenase family protein [Acidimicrobiales bacterium]|jgi:alkylation response protein AidB-like acyl-CoA dehydrogenase|nr:acyl-CoA dehydrogenase family protein [Acidimicrobiales bacterium]
MTDFGDALGRVITDVVAPAAAEVDRAGNFPISSIQALGDAGILGLTVSEAAGGGGQGLIQAAEVIRTVAAACGSTAMVVLMHYAATAVIERHGAEEVRKAIGAGHHLSTLAFSEAGSRSHFWAPLGTALPEPDGSVRLDAHKSWVTAAGQADSYVWSSRPLAAPGPMTLWLVSSSAPGLAPRGAFDGMGLRGNGSTPVDGSGVVVARDAMLGADGAGLDVALADVLPWFLVLSAAFSVGLMEAVVAETGAHLAATRLEHLDQSLAEQPLPRVDHARMRVATDQAAALLADTLAALEAGRPDASLRVLEVKAAAGEAAIAVTELAMKVCGGAAFRKEVPVERHFRDARAARIMAPTTDALLDFIGRAINGLPLL